MPENNIEASLKQLDRLSRLLDDRFNIPGTRWRIGLDGLLGIVPGAGDAVTTAVSAYIVWRAWRMGASKSAWSKMMGNMLLDATVGAIPLFGDIFDVVWKANRRNIRILQEEVNRKKLIPRK